MSLLRISSVADGYVAVNDERVRAITETKQLPPPPGSSLAVPAETARSQIQAAALLPAMTRPTADGIFTVGAAAVRVGKIGKISATSSWGF